jgi:thiamine-phosphate pyrophosphorylase
MAQAQPADVQPAASRLYLVTPVVSDAREFGVSLSAAMAAADIAAVLLRLAATIERFLINRV